MKGLRIRATEPVSLVYKPSGDSERYVLIQSMDPRWYVVVRSDDERPRHALNVGLNGDGTMSFVDMEIGEPTESDRSVMRFVARRMLRGLYDTLTLRDPQLYWRLGDERAEALLLWGSAS